jgi:SAM-dependent methyltransferase
VVELGCGGRNPLSAMFVFVMLGARRAIGVDLDAVADVPEAVRALARCAGWMLTDPRLVVDRFPVTRAQVAAYLAATRFDLAKLFVGDPAGVDRDRLDFRQESVTRLGIGDGEVDLCCSNSFLEHVDDVEAAIAEMARITKRGGRGAHCIDGIDHRSHIDPGVHPLKFLEEEGEGPIVHMCNRIRPRSFVPIFERHGFEVRRFAEWRRQEVGAEMQARFVEPYRSMAVDDLACTGATIWVRRR